METFANIMGPLMAVGIPTAMVLYLMNKLFALKHRKLDIEALAAAEKAAQYAARSAEIEQRLRVLEQIVTDRGVETAAQIEALRPRPSIAEVKSI